MVLETTFGTQAGTAVLTDAMAVGHNDRGHHLGAGSPGVLLRRLTCTVGEIDVDVSYAPRPEYGLIYPILEAVAGGIAARGGASRLLLSAPAGFQVAGDTATAQLHLVAGQTVSFALQHGQLQEPPLAAWEAGQIAARLQDTMEGWRSWSALHQAYEGPWRDLVHHSGRVLQALTFAPTGAIVAAPTTSLPETVGGERNWDYRYTWVRDASLTMEALWVAACPDEAGKFFGFLADAAASELRRGKDLQIMFGVGGEHDLSERELPHLAGWRASRPVRVGNGAWTQRQLDVYGELLDAAQRLADQLGELDPVTQQFLAAAADMAASQWNEKDQGIWEIRGEPRNFLYSKLMCWAALDRAIALAPLIGAENRTKAWAAVRDQIRAAILERGWNDQAGAFTQAFGSEDLDASSLMLAITGFLPGDDPRMKATVDAIADRLTDQRGLVYRYLAHDGLAGGEGTFLLCTFWLAHAQALAGELDQATATFECAVAAINDAGPASRGSRPWQRRDDRQLPAGVQPYRPGQRGLGHLSGPGTRGRAGRPARSRRRTVTVPGTDDPARVWHRRDQPHGNSDTTVRSGKLKSYGRTSEQQYRLRSRARQLSVRARWRCRNPRIRSAIKSGCSSRAKWPTSRIRTSAPGTSRRYASASSTWSDGS